MRYRTDLKWKQTNGRTLISEFSMGNINLVFYCVIRYTNNRTINRTKLLKILENISCILYTVFTYGFLYNVFIYKRLGQLGPMWLIIELDLCNGSRVMCTKFDLNWSRIAAVIVSTDKHPISTRFNRSMFLTLYLHQTDRHRQLHRSSLRSSEEYVAYSF